MSRAEFAARFGSPDLAGALCGYTREADTRTVLTLLVHARPRRVLEIGTALGHMTANLTRWTADDAEIFTMDIVQGMAMAAPGAEHSRSRFPAAPNGDGSPIISAGPQGVLHHGRHDAVRLRPAGAAGLCVHRRRA